MKVGTITNAINFKGSEAPVRLTDNEKAGIKAKAKAFEEKLIKLGQDGFVKRHEEVRKEQAGLSCRAQHCMLGDEFNFSLDTNPNFKTPDKRFQYLLRKSQKYQTDAAIDAFTDEKSIKFNEAIEHLQVKVENWKKQIKDAEGTIQTLMANRTAEIKAATTTWMDMKISALEKYFKESQEISQHHKEIKEKLESGELP